MQEQLTTGLILARLQQRVSKNNAKLLLDTAKVQCGVVIENEAVLEGEMAKTLCMRLINQGGPAFQVGQAIYKEYLM
jgi:hypothetical protein